MKYTHTCLLALALIVSNARAQQHTQHPHRCLTDYVYEQQVAANPSIKIEEERFNQQAIADSKAKAKTNGVVRIIPVVFHVIHVNGRENISKEQIDDQMRILNEDFRLLNPNKNTIDPMFASLAADCEIEFRLANRDPNGNCFSGINRVFSTLTNNGDDAVKSLVPSNWRNGKYFNIYVVAQIKDTDNDPNTTTLGYAQFPWSGASSTRGVVIRADYVGTIGTSTRARGGRTLTHEVGHCFGLFHTFQGGCSSSSQGGDAVADTPPAADQNFGNCSPSRNTCTNDPGGDKPDMLQNYMDYTNGDCQALFSLGQRDRMNSSLASYYSTLYSSSNLTATGVQGYTIPASTTLSPIIEGFENLANGFNLTTNWQLENLGGNAYGWRVTDSASYSGQKSIYLPAFYHPSAWTRYTYNFYTPSVNFNASSNMYVNFNVAYAQRVASFADTLAVYVSNNCGLTWNNILRVGGNQLSSVPLQTSVFVPANKSQWKSFTVNATPFKSNNVRFRFEFTYLRGNNIFIDDINISNQMVSDAFVAPLINQVQLFPNPSQSDAELEYVLEQQQDVTAEVYNMTGQQQGNINFGTLQPGKHSIRISEITGTSYLAEGVYLVRLKAGEQQHISKLVISR